MARKDTMVSPDGDAIRKRREALGLTRDDVGGVSLVSASIWQVAEKGIRPITERSEARILAYLDRVEAERRTGTVIERLAALELDRESLRADLAEIRGLVESLASELQAERGDT